MHLSSVQCERFYRLFYSLLDFANKTRGVLSEPFESFGPAANSRSRSFRTSFSGVLPVWAKMLPAPLSRAMLPRTRRAYPRTISIRSRFGTTPCPVAT